MAFENSQTFNMESKILVGTEQFENSCRLEVSNDKPIKKIVCVNSLPKILSSEKIGETVNFMGKSSYQVVYETENNEVASAMAEIEWQDKVNVSASEHYYLNPKTIENVVSGFSTTEIAITTLMNIDVYSIVAEKIESVEDLSSDYVIREKQIEYQRVVNTVSQTFNEVSEQEVPNKIDDVLLSTGDVRVKSVSAGIDSVTIEGDIFVSVSATEDNRIVNFNKVIEFKQEIAAISTVPNNEIDAMVNLSNLKVTASVNETDQKTNFIYSVEMTAFVCVFNKETANIIEDTYSINKEILTNNECVLKSTYSNMHFLSNNVTGIIETERDIDEVLFVSGANAVLTDMYQDEQYVILNGGVQVSLVCFGENKELIEVSGIIPFDYKVESAKSQDLYEIKVKINSYKLKNQKEVEICSELYILRREYDKEYVTYVSGLEEVNDKQISNAGIKVYITKEGEDLFNVSKAMSVRPEEVIKQNPNIAEGFTEKTRIIVYSQLDINF